MGGFCFPTPPILFPRPAGVPLVVWEEAFNELDRDCPPPVGLYGARDEFRWVLRISDTLIRVG